MEFLPHGSKATPTTPWGRPAMPQDCCSRNFIAWECWRPSSSRTTRTLSPAKNWRLILRFAPGSMPRFKKRKPSRAISWQRIRRIATRLFALTLTNGLQADYAALIDKRNVASLHYTKEANAWGQQTLTVDPECYDAHIAGGISKYFVGSMAAPVRWLVRLGGVSGDKQEGIKELRLVADRGHYLAPFANILLAIAYVRDHDKPRARELLASLRTEFPSNPLFGQEIARIDSGH